MMRTLSVCIIALWLAGCASTASNPGPQAGQGAARGKAVAMPDPPQLDLSIYTNAGPLLPEYQRVELDNGIVILLLVKPEVPIVGFEAIIRGGSAADPVGRSGTASLLAEMLRKGAGERDNATFADAVEGIGGELDTGAGLESVQVSGSFLSRDAALGVELLADLLMRPRLDTDEFAKLRERAVQFIRAAKDGSPNQLLPIYAATFLYGDTHPYGRPTTGDEDSLAALEIGDIREYYRDHIGADRLILTVAGDFDAARMTEMLADAFGSWRPAAAPLPDYESATRRAGGRVLLVDKADATQTYFWIGNVGVSKYYPQRAELALANTVFGGRFTSMLNTALRIESGLTYGASSRLSQPRQAGSVGIISFTATESTGQAIDLALQTLERLHEQGLAVDSLDSVKAYMLGQFPLAFETASQLARQAAQLEFYGLDPDWINAYPRDIVSAGSERISRVIEQVYPRREELVFVLIGNADAIRDEVTAYGDLTELSINAPSFAAD